MTLKNLPIGISTLSKILENNMVYVDKTLYIHKLATKAGAYFLSRPRRFGKSLMIDTLKSLFEGKEELFRGLYIHDKWDWDQKYPVIKIDFAGGAARTRDDLEKRIDEKLNLLEKDLGLTLTSSTATGKFAELIYLLYSKHNSKVVILVDEYDKPLLDNIENPEIIQEIRDGLRDFYSVIKEQDSLIQFVFLTGVSKFSKVSIFSGINNLKDITLSQEYGACCGYTEKDLDIYFKNHLVGVDRNLLKTWYNGYNYLGDSVYNPFDILLFISGNFTYLAYWFETGTPTFLMKLFKKNKYFLPDLENIVAGEEILSSFEIENIEPTTLLFQTGYLTIKSTETRRGRQVYKLGFPNFEVKTSFSDYLIKAYSEISEKKISYQDDIYDALIQGNFKGIEAFINRLFSGIAYRNYTNNPICDFEGYYASVLYAFFASIDCSVIPEDINNQGQADMTIILEDKIYVMEIKLIDKTPDDKAPNSALNQITEKKYAAKYLGLPNKQVYELGLVFGKEERNLVQIDWNIL
jgi:hypothetical protein